MSFIPLPKNNDNNAVLVEQYKDILIDSTTSVNVKVEATTILIQQHYMLKDMLKEIKLQTEIMKIAYDLDLKSGDI